MEPSYASGTSSTPLLGDTIGDNLDRAVARYPDREALVSVHQDLRYTYAQFGEAVDRARARVHRRRDRARRPRRASGARTAPSGRSSSTRRPRPGSSWSTSTRPTARPSSRTCSTSPAAGCSSRRRRSRPPTTSQMVDDVRDDCEQLERVVFIGRDWEEFIAARRARQRRRAGGAPGRDPVRRPDQHPVHERHHGLPEGRDAQPPQHPQQRLLRGRGLRLHRGGPRLHPGALLPLLRHGHGQPRLHVARRVHGHPGARLRPGRDAAGRPGRALHEPLRRADDVHRRARAPGVRRVRPAPPAHRDHGRLAVPDRDDEALRERDAHGAGHDLLRHDRDLAGVDADRRRRPAGEARRHRRARAPARRDQGRLAGDRRDRGARRARRAVHARLQRDARLLGRAGEDRRRDRPRALDAHRRPRGDGRRGLPEDRRAHQGHGHPRRRERLPARDRGVPDGAPGRRRRAGRRRPGPALRRGADGVRRHPRRRRRSTRRPWPSSARARSPTTRCRATFRW